MTKEKIEKTVREFLELRKIAQRMATRAKREELRKQLDGFYKKLFDVIPNNYELDGFVIKKMNTPKKKYLIAYTKESFAHANRYGADRWSKPVTEFSDWR